MKALITWESCVHQCACQTAGIAGGVVVAHHWSDRVTPGAEVSVFTPCQYNQNTSNMDQWRIYRGREGRAPPQSIFFHLQLSAKNMPNNSLIPLLENHGTATMDERLGGSKQ